MSTELPEDRLSIGMQLPIQAQSSLFAEDWEADAGADELAGVARAADEAGFAYIAVCDHVAIPREKAATMGTEWWDTVATLGWLAGITEHTRLLSHVYVAAFRHPLQVAKAFSTLDAISGGRIVLGMGAGHVEEEFEALGVDFAGRGSILAQSIDAIHAAFSSEYPEITGSRWSLSDMGQRPRPIQEGGPPIWVGGSSRAAMRRAATLGDGWLPQGPVDRELIDELMALRQDAGRTGRFDVGALAGPVYLGEPSWDVGGSTLVGDADRIAQVLNGFADMGVDQAQIQLRSRSVDELVEQIRLFGAEVLPLLRR